jgi:hypothetical protein
VHLTKSLMVCSRACACASACGKSSSLTVPGKAIAKAAQSTFQREELGGSCATTAATTNQAGFDENRDVGMERTNDQPGMDVRLQA